jgi:hypothetical protein
MTSTGIPVLAGIASTIIFAASVLPMLVKAWQTRDLRSYSRGNLVLANIGNGVHSVYVFDLPRGPIWALHGFYLVTSALMLLWSVQYANLRSDRTPTPVRATTRLNPDESLGERATAAWRVDEVRRKSSSRSAIPFSPSSGTSGPTGRPRI